jgi:hypothetical protein
LVDGLTPTLKSITAALAETDPPDAPFASKFPPLPSDPASVGVRLILTVAVALGANAPIEQVTVAFTTPAQDPGVLVADTKFAPVGRLSTKNMLLATLFVLFVNE